MCYLRYGRSWCLRSGSWSSPALHSDQLHRRCSKAVGSALDAYERFPEIAPFEHGDKGGRRVLKSVGDVLAILDPAICDASRYGSQERCVVFCGEVIVDET